MKRLSAVALLVLTPLFAACGGGNSGEDQIKDAVEQIATATEVEDQKPVCEELLTETIIEEIYTDEKQCLKKPFAEEDEITDPGETNVDSVEIEDSVATVKIETVGGDNDGVDGTWVMANEDGGWKLDRIEDDYLQAEFSKAAEIVDTGMIAYEPMRKCFLSKIDDLGSKDLRAIVFGESSVKNKKAGFEAANNIAESCPRALNGYIASSLCGEVIDKKDVPQKVAACAEKELVGLLEISGLAPQALEQNNEFGDSTAVALSCSSPAPCGVAHEGSHKPRKESFQSPKSKRCPRDNSGP